MNSAQLDLWQGELDALPWQGRSPRVLTRGHLGLIFKARAVKSVSEFVDPLQLELRLTTKKAPWVYRGAPLLQEV